MLNTRRTIQYVIQPQYVMEGAGVRLRRSFGPSMENQFDPFLLFDHFYFKEPKEAPIAGFPTHPHRGIETVTYMLQGFTRHRDSLGNIDTIGPGDIQWMTAGRGILHEEMPQRGPEGEIDGFQLWVNLPATDKMVAPRYQGVVASEIPTVKKEGVIARIVAGEYENITGPVTEIAANPLYMDISLEPGAEINLPVPEGHNAVAYLFEGEAILDLDNGQRGLLPAIHMIVFNDGDHLSIAAPDNSHARFMMMAGAPFKEQIFPYGPFVMNTREEIIQAYNELRNGTFVENQKEMMGW